MTRVLKSSFVATFGLFIATGCFSTFKTTQVGLGGSTEFASLSDATNGLIADRACHVRETSQYQACLNSLQANQADTVVIHGRLTCSQETPCHGRLVNVNRPVAIVGANENSGFSRVSARENSILLAQNCSQLRLQGLTFDEVSSQPWNDSASHIANTITIQHTPLVDFEGVSVHHSNSQVAIGIANVQHLNFLNSTVTRSAAMGLWINDTRSIRVHNSHFFENRSNALFIERIGNHDSLIENSRFHRNHLNSIYHSCSGPCGGGQIAIVHAFNLTIRNNHIWGGIIEGNPGLGVGGIELNSPTHMTIRENTIEQNTGSAVYSNGGTPVETNILNNTIRDNRSGAFYQLSGAYIDGNGPQN